MKFHEQVVVLVFVLSVVGDIGSFINTAWSGNELSSQNSALLIPGADAFAKLIVNILKNAAKKKPPKNQKAKVSTRKTSDRAPKENTKKARLGKRRNRKKQMKRIRKGPRTEVRKGPEVEADQVHEAGQVLEAGQAYEAGQVLEADQVHEADQDL